MARDARPLADKLRIIWMPLLLLVGAHALDTATTILAIQEGAVESNPVLADVAHDWQALAWIKVGVLALVLVGIVLDPMRSLWVPGSIWTMAGVSWAVVGWNLWGYTRFTGDDRLMPLFWGLMGVIVSGVTAQAAWAAQERGRTDRSDQADPFAGPTAEASTDAPADPAAPPTPPTPSVPWREKVQRTWLPLLLLVGAHALDTVTAPLALKAGGTGWNPLLAGVAHDWQTLALVKLAVLAVVVLGVCVDPMRSAWVPATLWAMTVPSWAVVGWDLAGYAQATGDGTLLALYGGLLVVLLLGVFLEILTRTRSRSEPTMGG